MMATRTKPSGKKPSGKKPGYKKPSGRPAGSKNVQRDEVDVVVSTCKRHRGRVQPRCLAEDAVPGLRTAPRG